MSAVQIVHLIAAFIVFAEAINKLERINPFASGISPREKLVSAIKTTGWILLAVGAFSALISPLLVPMGVHSSRTQLVTHYEPTLAEVCTMLGFALLIVRTRLKEG